MRAMTNRMRGTAVLALAALAFLPTTAGAEEPVTSFVAVTRGAPMALAEGTWTIVDDRRASLDVTGSTISTGATEYVATWLPPAVPAGRAATVRMVHDGRGTSVAGHRAELDLKLRWRFNGGAWGSWHTTAELADMGLLTSTSWGGSVVDAPPAPRRCGPRCTIQYEWSVLGRHEGTGDYEHAFDLSVG